MNHQDAVEQMSVERYLLGELTGESRDRFEDHLFDCTECSADLKQGADFLEAARPQLKAQTSPQMDAVPAKQRSSPLAWLLRPLVLAPALAASLAVIVYQSAVLLPGMRTELAAYEAPAVLEPLVLANAGARGGTVPEIVAPRHGSYLLSVDIPAIPSATDASGYRCSLYAPSGALLWHVDVPVQKAHDAVTIKVPVKSAQNGLNELRIQSIPATGSTATDVANYRYDLEFAP